MTHAKWLNSCMGSRYPAYLCDYGLEIWLAQRNEISVLELDMQLFYAQYGLQTWLALTQEFRDLAHILQPTCAEYFLEVWLTPTE